MTARVLEKVHTPLLLHYPEVVAECGADPHALLERAGIRATDEGMTQASYREIADLLELTAAVVGRADFGLMLAHRQCEAGIAGPLGELMQHAARFGDALDLVIGHAYAHSLASNSWMTATLSGQGVLLGHDILLEGLGSMGQIMEQILLTGHLIARRLTGGAVGARRVMFRHQMISPAKVYRGYFGCEVRFGQNANATLYWNHDLQSPIVSAHQAAFRQTLAAMEGRFPERQIPLSRLVRAAILHRINDEACTCEEVAERLGLHVRTMHRRLRSEATSFRRIKDQVRRDLALYYLRNTDLDVRTISERLGFSEQSVLTRRTRAWFSTSPTGFRTALRQEASAHRPVR